MEIDLPRYIDESGETIELAGGYSALIKVIHDEDHGAPWEECDGHGEVSEWTTRAKRPGEMVLHEDRGSKRYYDFQAAIAIAKRDGWDAPPYKNGTKGEQAHRAVLRDFEYLRAWCNDEWRYVGVCVSVTRNGVSVGGDSLWGIESSDDYWQDVAREMIETAVTDDKAARNAARRAAHREKIERAYWACRDVLTVSQVQS